VPRDIAFLEPHTVHEAVALLDAHGDDARIIAGATAVSILLRQGLIHPSALISISKLPGLGDIRSSGGELHIGALVTHRHVETSALVRQMLPALAETFGTVANIRIRNAATVGGVLAEADYASDPPAAFLALDAVVHVLGPKGARRIPIADFVQGFYATALAPNELVTHVSLPIPSQPVRAVYEKFITRSSEDRPCVGVFAVVMADGVRVAVGAAAETPQRFPDIEAVAEGQPLTDRLIDAIADAYAERIDTLSDMRGSAWYRTEMIRVWVRRALQKAVA
jgi:aerobic carbon-monoxide dehydrogenase medium subunit